MARATIELHDRSQDALSAVEDLHAVGFGDANVASIVMDAAPFPQPASAGNPSSEAGARSVRVSIPGLGPSTVTGWLADQLPHTPGLGTEEWLRQLLEQARPSDKDIEQVVAALRRRGAVVSVCSDERIGSQPTVSEVLKGRGG